MKRSSSIRGSTSLRSPSMAPSTVFSPSTSSVMDDPWMLRVPDDGSISWKEGQIRKQLKERSSEYEQKRKLSVVVCTWNVNQKLPNAETSMEELLHLDLDPDIVAVGLQEIDMTANAMIKQETEAREGWVQALDNEIFGAKSKYVRLEEKQLVGMFLTVYVKEKLSGKVKDLKKDSLGLGAMGKMGNKGGIGIRFRLFQSTFLFVTSHLAPHMGGTLKRNQNFADIIQQLNFNGQHKPDNHDYFFWCGDLNYRIEQLDYHTVCKMVKNKQYSKLKEYDQLHIERMSGRVFFLFREGDINFAPTYKYDPGTLTFDTSEKQRTPSWTDRVLYKGRCRDKVIQRSYDRYELLISDHLPVSSLFDVEVTTVQDYKYRSCREQITRELEGDDVNPTERPRLELSRDLFYFDNVSYGRARTEIIELTNPGRVVCEYQFVSFDADQDDCSKPWMKINPSQGLIIPGQTIQVSLTVMVDQSTAPSLNTTDGSLEDTLLIHLENGANFSVKIRGNFLRTSFANSLRNLIHIYGPIRQAPQSEDLTKSSIKLPIPKEIYKLVDYLCKYGLRTPGLLVNSVPPSQVDIVRDMLDRGVSLSLYQGEVHAVFECLVLLLESLPQPLIPYKYYKACIEHHLFPEKLVETVNMMPAVHYNVFHYIMSFLRELLANSDANELTIDFLSFTCCNMILRTPMNMPLEQQERDKSAKIAFIKVFLKEDQETMMNTLSKNLMRQT
ncbi:inositol polyphosphate 5-phosphatase [Acrasis kona]|uniref:Inositol polyphosphate 5-phosphatase n=1 Tax=Acrasis kona TaxID=1008807 RepID=A0AAW2Z4J0_9EUKA